MVIVNGFVHEANVGTGKGEVGGAADNFSSSFLLRHRHLPITSCPQRKLENCYHMKTSLTT